MTTTTPKLTLNPSHLDDVDQALLIAHAKGMSAPQIAKPLNQSDQTIREINRSLLHKLHAKTIAHAITQAFMQGILTIKHHKVAIDGHVISRTLCLCLVMLSTLQAGNTDMVRTRTPVRSSRTPTTVMRVVRAGRNKEV